MAEFIDYGVQGTGTTSKEATLVKDAADKAKLEAAVKEALGPDGIKKLEGDINADRAKESKQALEGSALEQQALTRAITRTYHTEAVKFFGSDTGKLRTAGLKDKAGPDADKVALGTGGIAEVAYLQQIINKTQKTALKADGVMGPDTLIAFKKLIDSPDAKRNGKLTDADVQKLDQKTSVAVTPAKAKETTTTDTTPKTEEEKIKAAAAEGAKAALETLRIKSLLVDGTPNDLPGVNQRDPTTKNYVSEIGEAGVNGKIVFSRNGRMELQQEGQEVLKGNREKDKEGKTRIRLDGEKDFASVMTPQTLNTNRDKTKSYLSIKPTFDGSDAKGLHIELGKMGKTGADTFAIGLLEGYQFDVNLGAGSTKWEAVKRAAYENIQRS